MILLRGLIIFQTFRTFVFLIILSAIKFKNIIKQIVCLSIDNYDPTKFPDKLKENPHDQKKIFVNRVSNINSHIYFPSL